MSVFTVLQHHPSRAAYLEQALSSALDRPLDHIEVDSDNTGIWPTYRRCLEIGYASGADRVLVLQDDIYPCRDFLASADKAAEVCPHMFSLFTTANNWWNYRPLGGIWGTVEQITGQAVCWVREDIPQFFEWLSQPEVNSKLRSAKFTGWDFDFACADWRAWKWALATSRPVYATNPSLVEHVANKPSQSLNTKIARGMEAHTFIGYKRSGLELDWDGYTF